MEQDREVIGREAVTVRPGDTLIVRVDPGLGPEQLAEFREKLTARLPDIAVVIVACDQIAAAKR